MLVLACATPMELRPALGRPLPAQAGHDMGGEPFAARLGKHAILALITGVGPINAAVAAGRVLAGHEISGIINLGVAGTYDEKALPLLETAAATAECWPEYGLATERGVDPEGIGLPLGRINRAPVFDRLELDPEQAAQSMGLTLSETWQRTDSVTVGAASGTPEHARILHGRYRALTENMEGFALAWACALADVPFLEIRTVSNIAGSRQPSHWRLKEAVAGLGRVARCLFAAS